MPDQVADIKARLDLAALIGERVPLKQRGRRFVALCPFHSEKTPSFTVSPELGIFKCFGCGASGDAYTFLERYEGMTFPEALEFLADRVGIKLERRSVDARLAAVDRKILEMNHLAAEYYHYLLTKHRVGRKARGYLKTRRVRSDSLQRYFLGYALDRWEGLLSFLTRKGYEPELIEQAGLAIRRQKEEGKHTSDFYDRFRGRVMFPLRDSRGQVVGFAGRTLLADVKEAKYINSPDTPVYRKGKHLFGIFENKEDIRSQDRAVLVEGELDAISSWQAGVSNVLAAKGTALTEDQVKLIRRYTRNVTVALDADRAGWEAFLHNLPALETHGMNPRVVILPRDVKDPDELATSNPARWRTLVGQARNVYEAVISGIIERVGANSGEEKKKTSELIVPILSGIKNAIEQDHWISEVAKRMGVRAESVRRQVETFQRTGVTTVPSPLPSASSEEKRGKAEVLSRYLLALLIQAHRAVPAGIDLHWVEPVGVKTIIETLPPASKRQSAAALRRLRETLPQELRQLFDDAALARIGTSDALIEQPDVVEREVVRTLRALELAWIRRQLRSNHLETDRIAVFTRRLRELSEID